MGLLLRLGLTLRLLSLGGRAIVLLELLLMLLRRKGLVLL